MATPYDAWRILHFTRAVTDLPGENDDVVAQPVGGGTVTKIQMLYWKDHRQTSDSPIVEAYLQMICHYVNTHAGFLGPGAPPNAIPDIILQPSEAYTWMMDEPGGYILAAIQLRDKAIARAIFQQAQYFFMPMNYQSHWALAVIPPIDRTVELLDSYVKHPRWQSYVNNVYVRIFQFLEYFLGPYFIPAQWRTLCTESPRQMDNISCGVHVCKNAMAIACRQPLGPRTYLAQQSYRERARIGSEILHGSFTGPFKTHPINAHPGPDNRLVTRQWQPVDPLLLTSQRRRWQLQNRTKQWHTNRCLRLNAARGPGWMRGHRFWSRAGRTRDQFLDDIELRLGATYQRTHVP